MYTYTYICADSRDRQCAPATSPVSKVVKLNPSDSEKDSSPFLFVGHTSYQSVFKSMWLCIYNTCNEWVWTFEAVLTPHRLFEVACKAWLFAARSCAFKVTNRTDCSWLLFYVQSEQTWVVRMQWKVLPSIPKSSIPKSGQQRRHIRWWQILHGHCGEQISPVFGRELRHGEVTAHIEDMDIL